MCEYLDCIEKNLDESGRDILHFRCYDFFEKGQDARLAARALHRHLNKSGGRLGGFQIKMSEAKRRRHGISWRATKVSPVKSVVIKNTKL